MRLYTGYSYFEINTIKKELLESEYKKALYAFFWQMLFCNLKVRSSLFLNDDGKIIIDRMIL